MIIGMVAIAAAAATPSPHATVEAMFAAFNAHDPAAMARLYADDARLTSSDFCTPRGKADIQRTYADLFVAMPDLNDRIETIVTDGDRVAVSFLASSATAKFKLPIIAIFRVRDGLIVADDAIFDTAGQPCSK
jgi:uncharacterized protein (TIGR02246 family)